MMGSIARMQRGLVVALASIACLVVAQPAVAAPPDTTIGAGPADQSLTNDNTPTFEFSADQTNVGFTCTIESAEAPTVTVGCNSPYTTAALAEGGHTFRVAATNSINEVDPSPAFRAFTVDTKPPETTITSGPSNGETINTDAPAFEWASSEVGSTFKCVTDGMPLTSCDLAFATGAAAGPHSFSVAATDPAGNTDPTPATRSFTISLSGAPPSLGACQYDGKVITGTSGADTRAGTAATDLMFGLGGRDVLRGLGGPDCISGGAGDDRLFGDAGIDYIIGGAGNDGIAGGAGNDDLPGGAGNDRITGSAGLDILVGDAGADRLTDSSGRDSFSGGAGNDRITSRDTTAFGRRARDTVRCGAGRFDVAIVDRGDSVSRDCERVLAR